MVTIKKYRKFDGKRYIFVRGFLLKGEANGLASRLRSQGKSVRVLEKAGELHWNTRYHVYSRG